MVASARPAMRAYLDLVATCAALAFLLLIAWPAYEYAYEESFITTPALQIANIWRAAALPVGIGLMALFALLRLARSGDVRTVLGAILSVVAVIAVFWLLQGLAEAARQSQPDHLLCRRGRLLRVRRRADRVRIWACDLRLSGADHEHAADGAGRPHGRGHEPPHPAVGAAVRVPRPADRDDRHGARHGGVPGEPARPCPRRAALRAGRRDVSGLGHFGLQGRRHGRRGAGAVSGNEGARRQAGRSRRPARGHRRADRNHSAEPRADHDRLGHRRLDRGAVHRRIAAGRGAGDHAVGAGVVALPRTRICGMSREPAAARSSARSPSPCPPSRCRS